MHYLSASFVCHERRNRLVRSPMQAVMTPYSVTARQTNEQRSQPLWSLRRSTLRPWPVFWVRHPNGCWPRLVAPVLSTDDRSRTNDSTRGTAIRRGSPQSWQSTDRLNTRLKSLHWTSKTLQNMSNVIALDRTKRRVPIAALNPRTYGHTYRHTHTQTRSTGWWQQHTDEIKLLSE